MSAKKMYPPPTEQKKAPAEDTASAQRLYAMRHTAQVAKALQKLRARGRGSVILAIAFDEEREYLREEISELVREQALAKRRKEIAAWTQHARQLAAEFAATGDWQCCRALLVHVAAMQQRLREGKQ